MEGWREGEGREGWREGWKEGGGDGGIEGGGRDGGGRTAEQAGRDGRTN